jgi:hypothetical protein
MPGHAVFAGHMLGGQRRPKPLVDRPAILLPDQRPDPGPLLRRPRVIRWAARTPVLHAFRAVRPIPPDPPLRLPVPDAQQHRRRLHRHRAGLHPRQDLDPRQCPRTHCCPSQSATSPEIASLGGHFYFARKGTLLLRCNNGPRTEVGGRQAREPGMFPCCAGPWACAFARCQSYEVSAIFRHDIPRSARASAAGGGYDATRDSGPAETRNEAVT